MCTRTTSLYAVYLFKVLAELMVDEGVSHVLESHCSVAQQATLRVMLRIVPGEVNDGVKNQPPRPPVPHTHTLDWVICHIFNPVKYLYICK
jgi:hypothetical protein